MGPDGQCAAANYRRVGEVRSNHDGQTSEAKSERTRGDLRCRGYDCPVATIPTHRAPAMGAEIRG
jgi:hypothetical protein